MDPAPQKVQQTGAIPAHPTTIASGSVQRPVCLTRSLNSSSVPSDCRFCPVSDSKASPSVSADRPSTSPHFSVISGEQLPIAYSDASDTSLLLDSASGRSSERTPLRCGALQPVPIGSSPRELFLSRLVGSSVVWSTVGAMVATSFSVLVVNGPLISSLTYAFTIVIVTMSVYLLPLDESTVDLATGYVSSSPRSDSTSASAPSNVRWRQLQRHGSGPPSRCGQWMQRVVYAALVACHCLFAHRWGTIAIVNAFPTSSDAPRIGLAVGIAACAFVPGMVRRVYPVLVAAAVSGVFLFICVVSAVVQAAYKWRVHCNHEGNMDGHDVALAIVRSLMLLGFGVVAHPLYSSVLGGIVAPRPVGSTFNSSRWIALCVGAVNAVLAAILFAVVYTRSCDEDNSAVVTNCAVATLEVKVVPLLHTVCVYPYLLSVFRGIVLQGTSCEGAFSANFVLNALVVVSGAVFAASKNADAMDAAAVGGLAAFLCIAASAASMEGWYRRPVNCTVFAVGLAATAFGLWGMTVRGAAIHC